MSSENGGEDTLMSRKGKSELNSGESVRSPRCEEVEEVEEVDEAEEDMVEIMDDDCNSEVNIDTAEELLQELRASLNEVPSPTTCRSFTSSLNSHHHHHHNHQHHCGLTAKSSSKIVQLDKRRLAIFSFPAPVKTFRLSYNEQKALLAKAMLAHHWFSQSSGQYLLQTHEKGVLFPITHIFELPDNKESVQFLDPLCLGHELILYQALYQEIGRMDIPVITSDSSCSSHSTSNPCSFDTCSKQAFLVVGFKTLDSTFNHLFEENWKDFSGARSIYLHLSTDYGLSDLQLYRRIHPNDHDFSTFAYILFVKLNHVTRKNHVFLLDFVHRLRLRMLGYVSLYGHVVESTTVVSLKQSTTTTTTTTASCSSTESESNSDDYALGGSSGASNSSTLAMTTNHTNNNCSKSPT